MASSQETHFLRSIMPTIPKEMASKIRQLCLQPTNEILFENMVRFLSGAPHSSEATEDLRMQWSEKQVATRSVLGSLISSLPTRKRTHTDEETDSQLSKRQRLTPSAASDVDGNVPQSQEQGALLYTLHSISTTSPIRKKVDVTIRQDAIVFTNPSTKTAEGSVRLSTLKRAFVVPTRGKSKAHWTVILISNDIPENPKAKQPQGQPACENQQIIFGLDASSSATFTTTSYTSTGDANPQTHPKNTSTLPLIQKFLSYLNIQTILPTTSIFKSACGGVLAGASASGDGIPGVEAYRAAKAGNLWFSEDGILWGESKPCEFWDVKDLLGKDDGVRVIGTGRTCTIILTRRSLSVENEDVDGEETEFGMVDSREREPITAWIRSHRHLFGTNGTSPDKGKGKEKQKVQHPISTGPLTIHSIPDEDDDEDEEFTAEVSDLDGSEATSDSGSNSGSDDERNGTGDDADADAEHSDGEESDLNPAHHPLLRPGAVPRLSKAALNMAVGIIEDTFMGDGSQDDQEEDIEEEDELQD